ncbi:NPCBM/NEW2 domain-containing protein [Planctomycetes bacterium K23_9]|uniref:NPCBM/NEW2 domain protein n=1 Tax=Stieleria marina TaxID=1930275 RepID=A0A517NZ88_9BACT|nr:NPCBM/NEW2 domain protein [Planctomycetes bacterium K23_9]
MGFALAFSVVLRSIGVFIVAVLPIEVTTTDGKVIDGDFAGIGESELKLDVDGETRSFSFEDLQAITPADKRDDATGPTSRVTLVGGSEIAVQDMTLANEQFVIEPRRQKAIKVPMNEVRSIRFRTASPATDSQWLGLLEQEARGDLLAIRRANDQLDPAPGLVEAIGGGVVKFSMDGDTVDAPIERLEGIVLSSKPSPSKSAIQIVDHYGSRFAAVNILASEADAPLRLQLSDSVTHTLPLKHLQSIFFSGGLQMLAQEPPSKADYAAYVETKLATDLQSQWFGPKADGDDVVISGSGSVEYRVSEKYSKLAGAVRRDQSVDKAGDVTVEIFVDDKSVWKETLTDAQPRGFELPTNNARRIRFVADCGNDGDLGDKVRITRPRLLK